MKEFVDFAREIRSLYGNNYHFQGKKGELGAYGMSRQEIYDSGYSINGYAPNGEQLQTILPLKVFFREHFLQDKLFIILCRNTKRVIRDEFGSTAENLEFSESGLVAALILEKNMTVGEIKNLLQKGQIAHKEYVIKERLTSYIKRFSGFDLISLK